MKMTNSTLSGSTGGVGGGCNINESASSKNRDWQTSAVAMTQYALLIGVTEDLPRPLAASAEFASSPVP